ncbi:DUF192 domain-containing protein [Aurantibacter sp.]|uniref:DUF192 domain-containing protein n=1 Tax=Aurantibacter sp. TaxID=2807103 RepID=UPI0035C80839
MKLYIYSLSIAFSILVFSCKKEQNSITTKVEDVVFTKEGKLTLTNDSTKTVITQLDIEFAETEYETQTGLMYRNSMKQNQGMLFIFKDEKPRSFYMKNTRIPLDIIYINANQKIVSFQENAEPFNQNSLPSNKGAKYVLEVNAGLAKQWNLQVGNSISYIKM